MLVVCVLTESRDALSARRRGENEVGCVRGDGFLLVCPVSVSSFPLLLYLAGVGRFIIDTIIILQIIMLKYERT